MKKNSLIRTLALGLTVLALGAACTSPRNSSMAPRWTEAQANAWYDTLPWLTGCDYIPATAINQIEMWSAETYDSAQIDKEMAWAEDLGFNTMRVFLSSVVYDNDPDGLKARIDHFLGLCQRHGVRPFFVFFDDCWNPEATYGPQPEPKPGVHNSGWLQDPSCSLREDTVALYPKLETYVKDILHTFGNDPRVLFWDLWNEPGNSGHVPNTLPILKKVYTWAREAAPSQPLTIGVWTFGKDINAYNAFQLEHSDIISYHNYSDAANHAEEIKYLQALNRPLVCTEYMCRRQNSYFQNIMPLLKQHKVVAINWGFVAGKTNTIFAWNTPLPDVEEPELWFHDILRKDGTPFDQAEVDTIRSLTGRK